MANLSLEQEFAARIMPVMLDKLSDEGMYGDQSEQIIDLAILKTFEIADKMINIEQLRGED